MALPSDLIDLLAEFDAEGVEYLLVGGQALAVHGVPRFTKDADVWVRDEARNLERAIAALKRFGAPSSVLQGLQDASGLDVVWMGLPPNRIDLMKAVPGGDFEHAWSRRERVLAGDVPVQVVGRADLVALKQASGRPQDLVDVEMLTGQRSD
jgi:hypothetical protein